LGLIENLLSIFWNKQPKEKAKGERYEAVKDSSCICFIEHALHIRQQCDKRSRELGYHQSNGPEERYQYCGIF
jgi:hypothetical protein